MEAKLKEYRARRRRQELIENTEKQEDTKKKVELLVPTIYKNMEKEKNDDEVLLLDEEEEQETKFIPLQTEDPEDTATEAESIEELPQESWRYFIIKWTIYIVIWVTLYAFFLKAGFGAVFFVISLLVFICINTRTRRRQPGEVSAYSVFNENCTSIEGTLQAEELQRQMFYGIGIGGLRLF